MQEIVAEIDLHALEKNLRQVEARIGTRKIIPVVKANAYGHGAVAISKHLIQISKQVAMLGVASLDEGISLRNAGIKIPILLMTGCPPDGIPDLIHHNLTPALFDSQTLALLSRQAHKAGRKIGVHIKIDTGMGRLGLPVSSPHDVLDFIRKTVDCKGIRIEGVFSHFAEADLADLSFAREQLVKFKQISTRLARETGSYCHLANSAAIIHFAAAHLDRVRPGLMLYGYSPLQKKAGRTGKDLSLCPVMTLKSRVISLKIVPAGTSVSYGRTFITQRKTRLAVIAIGYADGYPRRLSNCGEMIANGKRVPVVGRVCMDMTMLDVTAVPELSMGDWVTVIGKEGTQAVWADTLAQKADTIPYELLCGIREHIPRIYHNV